MKRVSTIIGILILLTLNAMSQVIEKSGPAPATIILQEGFEEYTLPTEWVTVDDECTWEFGSNGSSPLWTIPSITGYYAMALDSDCSGSMSDVKLVTPNIDLTDVDAAILQFKTFNYVDECKVEITLDQGTSYTELEVLTDNNSEWTIIEISLNDYVGQDEVRISFNYNDLGGWGYGWAIDDVLVFEPMENDLSISSIVQLEIPYTLSVYPGIEIKNTGILPQDDFTIDFVINDGTTDVYTSTLNVTSANLLSLESNTYTMTDEWTSPDIGDYTITASIDLIEDQNSNNDTKTENCVVAKTYGSYIINGATAQLSHTLLPFGNETDIAATTIFPFSMAMEYAEDVYYLVNSDSKLLTIDVATGVQTEIGSITGVSGTVTGLAYNWKTETMYLLIVDGGDVTHLCTIDLTTAVLTDIGTAPAAGMMIAMDFDNLHNLYGTSITTDKLYKIDISDGSVVEVGDLGHDLSYGQDISYNMYDGKMYAYLYGENDDTKGLFEINLADASTIKITEQLAQIGGFAIPFDNVITPKFISYSIPNQIDESQIDYDNFTVDIIMPEGTDLSSLIANYVLPYDVTCMLAAIPQESGVSTNDFTSPVVYAVTVDGGDTQDWTVTVSSEEPIIGTSCDLAIDYGEVDSPAQTGQINAGEEVWYSFFVPIDTEFIYAILCESDFNTKIEAFANCATPYSFQNDENGCGMQSLLEFTDLTVGTYYLKISGFSGSYGTYDLSISYATNIDETESTDIDVYPNPSTGIVNIKVREESTVKLFDISGRIINEFNINEFEEFNFFQSSGMYVIQVESKGGISSHKLIIE